MLAQRRWLVGSGALVLLLVGLAFWFIVLRGDAPPPVSLEGALESVSTPVATAEDSPTASAETTPADDADSLAGRWTVSTQGESFVGYRVRQVVAGVDAPTRVGRTPAVTAAVDFDTNALVALVLEADLTLLMSGDERRDAVFADILETDIYATATFVLTLSVPILEVIDAETVAVEVDARLTLHGVTRDVTLTLEGETTEGLVVLVGSTEILFRDFGVDRPTAFAVLSIEDRAELELQLVLERE